MIDIPKDPFRRHRSAADSLEATTAAACDYLEVLADTLRVLGSMPGFSAMVRRLALPYYRCHDLRSVEASVLPAPLRFTIERAIAIRLLGHAEIVNWLAHDAPAQLAALQALTAVRVLPGAARYPPPARRRLP